MEIKNKEAAFRKIQKRIKSNTKSISVYKKLIPVLMLLFVFNAFLMFYFNVKNVESNVGGLFVIMLILIFLTLTLFRVFTLVKKKENRSLDTKIYNLLRL